MKILVTGANGQLGECLKAHDKFDTIDNFRFYERKELDVTNMASIFAAIDDFRPEAVVNCAAYVNTVAAEKDMRTAYEVNTMGPANLAHVCKEKGIRLIHISTDFVFNGEKNTPYNENEDGNPINVYGITKYFGEISLLKEMPSAVIIRTSWLYSEYGNNFVKKVIDSLTDSYFGHKFVYDQISCPTYAINLAKFIVEVCRNREAKGIYHFTDDGVASRYDFAKAIEDIYFNGRRNNVVACTSNEFSDNVKRPIYSVLGKERIKEDFPNYHLEDWRRALSECIHRIKEEE